ncbi:riboflavin biosynthesis protein PYRR, chloroplastic-like isoform X1 [Solanum stenotomum]|uniref:riboflavin biosynthesis protein PYRR, chloroplastic-like isoform X1 n=1 Tax=Solanum stenotomum TaxID=172797 RepID=UPI0020D0DA83|nr:riboflavin biosynthesis protein PYRR, chloroplastic-like isoform X1 [Solanum stenotomum]
MAHFLGGLATPFLCKPISASSSSNYNYTSASSFDSLYIKRAAELADKSAGFTAPHPNFGCVIAVPNGGGTVVGESYLYAEGTIPAEVQAVEAAGEQCRGATAYLNMEPGDCHCDCSAVSALIKAGISRVVVGIRHPLQHLRGNAIHALRSEGLQVDVLGEDTQNKTIEVI